MLSNPRPENEIENIQHDDSSDCKRILMKGRTTSGEYVTVLLNDNGSFK